jgi:hypothetical protein
VSAVEQQFEPMTIGMVLDRAFRLYTQNFPLMFGITAILNVPTLLIALLPQVLTSTPRMSATLLIAALLSVLVSLLTLLVIYPLVTGAITKAVSDKYLGNSVTIGEALKEAWSNVGTLLLTQWVAGLIVLLGLFLLVVPGILWMLSYSLIAPVVMIEASDPKRRRVHTLTGESRVVPVILDRTDIRRRSWDLVKGNRGKVFVIFLIIFIMNILLNSGGGWVTTLIFEPASRAGAAVQTVLRSVIDIFVSPLQTIAITLLYYDFRIRKEGFDLEMLSQAMGGSTLDA